MLDTGLTRIEHVGVACSNHRQAEKKVNSAFNEIRMIGYHVQSADSRFGSRSSSVDFYNSIDAIYRSRKQWQTSERINCLEYHDPATKAGVACNVLKRVSNYSSMNSFP